MHLSYISQGKGCPVGEQLLLLHRRGNLQIFYTNIIVTKKILEKVCTLPYEFLKNPNLKVPKSQPKSKKLQHNTVFNRNSVIFCIYLTRAAKIL